MWRGCEGTFLMAMPVVRSFFTRRVMLIRGLNRTIHRADDKGGFSGASWIWHPARRQQCAQRHRDNREVHGGAADSLHNGRSYLLSVKGQCGGCAKTAKTLSTTDMLLNLLLDQIRWFSAITAIDRFLAFGVATARGQEFYSGRF
jgi:hypothetical protein